MLTDAALRLLIAVHALGVALSEAPGARTQDERGQTLAEYSLIISAIAVAVVIISVLTFRQALVGAWNSAIPCLSGSC